MNVGDAPEMYGKQKQFLDEVKLLNVTIMVKIGKSQMFFLLNLLNVTIMAKIGKSQMFVIFWYGHITVQLQNCQVVFLVRVL